MTWEPGRESFSTATAVSKMADDAVGENLCLLTARRRRWIALVTICRASRGAQAHIPNCVRGGDRGLLPNRGRSRGEREKEWLQREALSVPRLSGKAANVHSHF